MHAQQGKHKNNNNDYEWKMMDTMFAGFDPNHYIQPLDDGFALCSNPVADGGLSAITVNTNLAGEARRNFEQSIKRMVLSKLFSPKFGEVILAASSMNMQREYA